MPDILILIVAIFVLLLMFWDIRLYLERNRKIDRLMRLVKRGELSYIQFVNEVVNQISDIY